MQTTVRELTAEEIRGIYPFILQLNPDMPEEEFFRLLPIMIKKGYRCAGAFDAKGECLGIAGFWMLCRFWCALHVDIDNVVVLEKNRNQGVGGILIQWIEEKAKAEGANFAALDSYTHARPAHKFYHREGYSIRGFHFTKDL